MRKTTTTKLPTTKVSKTQGKNSMKQPHILAVAAGSIGDPSEIAEQWSIL